METVSIRLSAGDLARLDEMRAPEVSRSAFIRSLLRGAGPLDEQPSYGEALRLLGESARGGKVQAQVALERALRGAEGAPDDGWMERLLGGNASG